MSGSTGEKTALLCVSRMLRIEELIKGRTFSREEINHFLAILNSRADSELEKKPCSDLGGLTEQDVRIHEIQRTPMGENHHVSGMIMSCTFREASDIPDEVGASPVDIARAYMAGRTLEQGHGYMQKIERIEPSSRYTQPSLILSPLPRPSACWPGAMVDDQHHHMKLQQQTSGMGPHDFPRTPYSRTISSRSITKEKLRHDSIDGYGSVGPIRRIRNKLASEIRPRGSTLYNSSKEVPSEVLKSSPLTSFLPASKNLEPGETSGISKFLSDDNESGIIYRDAANTNPLTSQAVRKVLEHLDRNNSTAKEKVSDQFTSLGKPTPSESSVTKNKENMSSRHSVEFASPKRAGLDSPLEFYKSSSNSNACPIPSFGLKGYSVPTIKNSNEKAFDNANHDQEKDLHSSPTQQSNGLDVKAVNNSTNDGNKPSLPSIFINKSGFGAGYSENNPGFTFPISTSSGVIYEPPTPTIMPSASILSAPSGMSSVIPSYSFGANKPTPPIVFSFPSMSNTSIDDALDLQFKFGSDKNTRLSFSSFECH